MHGTTRNTLRPDLVSTVFPLVEAIRRMLARVETIWSAAGINPSEAAVLERLFIDFDGEARSGDLLGHPIRSTPALGKVLASLEDKRLITRQRSADDRRVVVVTGTGTARRLYDEVIDQIVTEVVEPSTAELDDEGFAELRRVTQKLRPPDVGA
jgi:DNA-binding MarR family transcriptional regulator